MKPKGRPVRWNREIAYVVGLITTDGNLSIDGYHLEMTSNDIQLLDTFKRCLGIKNKIAAKFSTYTGKKSCYRVQFGNVILYKWLLNLGLMPNKSKKLGVLKIPDKYFFHFLRGHLDGDGCIRKYQDPIYPNSKRLYIRFFSASPRHIQWIQKKIKLLLGIEGYTRHEVTGLLLSFAKKDSLKLLPYLYPTKNVPCLKRKYKIIKEFLVNPAEVVKFG